MGAWVGDGLRREVFFFDSTGVRLYGSLYVSTRPTRSDAVVICNSWGFEANQADRTKHAIARETARSGGAALLFDYAGFGDSEGEPAEATLESLVANTADAVAEGARRVPGVRWGLAGLMLGATVASLAACTTGAERLLLVQPALRPSHYFHRLQRSAARAALRVPARADNAYGYPLPREIVAGGATADAAVMAALEAFSGDGAIVRHEEPGDEPVPERFSETVVPGRWRFGAQPGGELARAAIRRLAETVEGAAG